jgi:prepilin-type N-terminal cleavage/methylation domain-containing protein
MKTKIQKQFSPAAFTLIELLVVISIIGVLAAFIIGGLAAAKKSSYRSTAKAELKFIEAAIENYKVKYGSYPPSNRNTALNYDSAENNQLYYELSGVTKNTPTTFLTLDSATSIVIAEYTNAFGHGGVVNTTRGSGDDAVPAQNFLTGLKLKQINEYWTNDYNGQKVRTTTLVTSIGGPDDAFTPNPFRYNSVNPTNNPNSYDLWIDLVISGKPYRIGNWTAK